MDSDDEIEPYPFDEPDNESNIVYKEISKRGLGRHRGSSFGESSSSFQTLSDSRKIKAGTLYKLVEKVTDHKELGTFLSLCMQSHL